MTWRLGNSMLAAPPFPSQKKYTLFCVVHPGEIVHSPAFAIVPISVIANATAVLQCGFNRVTALFLWVPSTHERTMRKLQFGPTVGLEQSVGFKYGNILIISSFYNELRSHPAHIPSRRCSHVFLCTCTSGMCHDCDRCIATYTCVGQRTPWSRARTWHPRRIVPRFMCRMFADSRRCSSYLVSDMYDALHTICRVSQQMMSCLCIQLMRFFLFCIRFGWAFGPNHTPLMFFYFNSLSCYRHISDSEHSTENSQITVSDCEGGSRKPWPFCTGSLYFCKFCTQLIER